MNIPQMNLSDYIDRNSKTFTKVVVDLMSILASWPKRENPKHGLTLELSAFSPSDSKHAFKYFCLEQNYPYQRFSDCDPKFTAYKLRAKQMKDDGSLHDPAHGWVEGYQVPPTSGAKLRLQGSLLFLPEDGGDSSGTRWESLRVRVVTGLLVRRQFYRKIPIDLLSDLVHKVCPLLENFSHESWLDMTGDGEVRYPDPIMVRRLLNLSSICLFADYNRILHPHYSGRSMYREDRRWRLDISLSRTLCINTQHLERLASTSVIDARDFFSLFAPQVALQRGLPLWWRLRNVALTSSMLIKQARHWEIEYLFVAAGRAAARMPQLETMEIWNGGKGHVAIFGYYLKTKTTITPHRERSQQEDRQFTISWTSTWKWGPDPRTSTNRVARAWEQALGLASHTIEARYNKIPASKVNLIRSRTSTIKNLALRDIILHPVSLYQLRWEDREARMREKESF